MNFQNSIKLAVAGLSAIAVFGTPESAKAAVECGRFEGTLFTGPAWVSNCPAGVDIFPNSWAKIQVLIPELSPFPFLVKLQGPATITRQAGANGRIITTINEVLTGGVHLTPIPGIGAIKLTGTNGLGAIEDPDGDGFATSFFDVPSTIDVETPSGILTLNSERPVPVFGDRDLVGVSPDMITPLGFPLSPDVAGPNCPRPDLVIPPISIAYCGNTPIALLDENGIQRGTILAEVHTVHPAPPPTIPEPSSTTAFVATLGAAIFGLKRKPKKDS